MIVSHDDLKYYVCEHLEDLTGFQLFDAEASLANKRIDILALDGSELVAIEIKLDVTKEDVEQVVECKTMLQEISPDIRVALFGLSFNNIYNVPSDIGLCRMMIGTSYKLHDGIPRYKIAQMSIAPYNLRSRRIDERFMVTIPKATNSEQQPVYTNPLLRHRSG